MFKEKVRDMLDWLLERPLMFTLVFVVLALALIALVVGIMFMVEPDILTKEITEEMKWLLNPANPASPLY